LLTENSGASGAQIITPDHHSISRQDISVAALKVLTRLHEGGFQGYLVGGGVRDLLLGMHPKDFDVATDATPEQVKSLFRNCRLIGRRFRLAHVIFGRETIEVATFRGEESPEDDDDEHRRIDESGRLLKDNIYGNIEQDVWRRDFTCNALYYNSADHSIRDFVGGLSDIEHRLLRLIGDPQVRYREDPVRMLRAARFSAKLWFAIEASSRAPIQELSPLLNNVPPARLFDETLKLFLTGHGETSLKTLQELNLLHSLLPPVAEFLAANRHSPYARIMRLGLANTDQRVIDDRPVSPVFLFIVLLLGCVEQRFAAHRAEGLPVSLAHERAVDGVLAQLLVRVGIPKRFTLPLKEVLVLIRRLRQGGSKRANQALSHPRFRMAYDVIELESMVGQLDPEVVEFWATVQTLDGEQRQAYIREHTPGDARHDAATEESSDAPTDKPNRRRRRRPRRREG